MDKELPLPRHHPLRRSRGTQQRRARAKPKKNKAQIRRELRASINKAFSHLRLFNRVEPPDQKGYHLERAIRAVEGAIDIRPGNHVLQRQLALCELASWSLQTGQGRHVAVEILLSPDQPAAAFPRRL